MHNEKKIYYFSWDEIKKHNSIENGWVVIKCLQDSFPFIYALSDIKNYPNLTWLTKYAGTDATEAFYRKFNCDCAEVKMLHKMKIGVPENFRINSTVFDHICIAIPTLSTEAMMWIKNILGGKFDDSFDSPQKFRGIQVIFDGPQFYPLQEVSLPQQGGRLEILEPFYAESFLHSHIKKFGPSAHHITFKVPNLEERAKIAEELGFKLVDYMKPDMYPKDFGWRHFFLHPLETPGIVVQLAEVQANKEFNYSLFPSLNQTCKDIFFENHPEGGIKLKDSIGSTAVNGIHLIVPSEEKAMNLFSKLLEGTPNRRNNEITFNWPTSSMYVRTTINPNEAPRPLEIDITLPPNHPSSKLVKDGYLNCDQIMTPFKVAQRIQSKI